MTSAALAAALLFMACPPPGGACRRLGVSGDAQQSSFAVVGDRWRQMVASPRTRCPTDDEVKASVRLLDPDGVEAPFEQGPLQAADLNFASTNISFTPSKPGAYRLEVDFGALLGKSLVDLEAVPNGELRPYQRVVSPISCSGVWPLSDDTIACESQGSVLISSTDGGSFTFSGRELAVAGTALWSVDGEELQRREFIDGGLVLTHTALGFSSISIATLHTPQVAVRSRANEGVGRAEVSDGGLVISSLTPELNGPFFFEEPDAGLLSWESRYPCTPEPCTDGRAIVAIEPGIIWFQLTSTGVVEGVDRPWSPLRRRLPRYQLEAQWGRYMPRASSDRVPLWLDASLDQARQILVTAQDGGLSFTAWVPTAVANVSGEHVVVREGNTGAFRIYRRE